MHNDNEHSVYRSKGNKYRCDYICMRSHTPPIKGELQDNCQQYMRIWENIAALYMFQMEFQIPPGVSIIEMQSKWHISSGIYFR